MKRRITSAILALLLCVSLSVPAFAAGTPTVQILTDAIYDDMGNFSEGLIWARNGDLVQYLDGNGKVALSLEKYRDAVAEWAEVGYSFGDFHQGYAYFNVSDYEPCLSLPGKHGPPAVPARRGRRALQRGIIGNG
ncbi:MAG: WG repeat-containing protein [Oscillospiraceae bacterium]|jgi:hypothetical protein|nr:WG repeat-containing protein [Oscillospiraceae bacterium]